ncbi:retrotransposon protein, putative, unclassified [Panicum miliaceum]|uniref:Retrotransposon protein, putative, unclassified n=1 Tax=Panicum miliaceum TaxID=4540 RepID=A0A3L6SVR5_PANMI|nr:retrotransposon protein, putative, unclassified [Panicum miliaceum]
MDGCAGTGVVARDSAGRVVLMAWRAFFNCASAVEAEALACVEGIKLASQWCQGPIILESNCARVCVK